MKNSRHDSIYWSTVSSTFTDHPCTVHRYYIPCQGRRQPHTYIGDIAVDSNLSHPLTHQQHTLITFTQLQRTVESGSHLFNVTNSGKLYTTQTLDAESLCTYNKECSRIVKVAVRKGKTFMKILKVKILIDDINDHSPEFPQNEITIKFLERDSKGTKIPLLNAIDEDVSIKNSQITYMIMKSEREPFSLSVTKRDGIFIPELILEDILDREVKDSYMLTLEAKDGGNPPKTATLKVHVSVMDVNDNIPVFSRKVYNISIDNSHQRHLPILTLKATDQDSGENGKISYHFNHKTSRNVQKYFVLDKKTGDLFLHDNFQVSKKQTYKLFIEARDGGNPPLKSVARVHIYIINNQNIAPLINIDFVSPLSESSAAVSEDSEVDSFIAYVMVTDNDSGPNGEVICDLKHDKFKLAKIDSKDYKIIVKGHLDREIRDHYKVSIVCHDMGSPQLESKKYFSVKVTDVNDVEPHFTKETFQFLTYENQKVDFPIGFINATDPDLGDGGQLTYSIINDNNNDNIPFQLTNMDLVLVKDNGTPSLNDTANIVIEILDKNDNAPYFTFPNNDPYNLDVHYHPHSKKDITILRASDKDTGNNAFLTYGILRSNDKNLFTVNSHTGVLSFSRTVYQNDAGTYELQFIVKDGGTPVQSATTAIILTLFVSNDTSPMLTAVPFQSGHDLNMTWVIIIVAAAVILSVAIVVSITLCVFRCINHTNNSPTTAENPNFLSQTEMRQLLYQTNNPVAITRNAEEIFNRNLQTIKSKSQFFLEMEQTPDEWKFSTTQRRLPPVPQRCDSIHSQGRRTSSIMSYNSDTLTSQKDREASKSNGKTKPYDEIPAEPEYTNDNPVAATILKGQQIQDTYLQPT
ncbi:protocadherin beta-15-like [Octopus sinensis]|uniref:Protocadherin beta-15-like n=1 Tax=Octopus sinensis TaxID=2607531 RepID=A0A7E6FC25_9MOLL|nr:protocadherin beta-15-like [Octopus sinensis]